MVCKRVLEKLAGIEQHWKMPVFRI
jgi:hypothetical protein